MQLRFIEFIFFFVDGFFFWCVCVCVGGVGWAVAVGRVVGKSLHDVLVFWVYWILAEFAFEKNHLFCVFGVGRRGWKSLNSSWFCGFIGF